MRIDEQIHRLLVISKFFRSIKGISDRNFTFENIETPLRIAMSLLEAVRGAARVAN